MYNVIKRQLWSDNRFVICLLCLIILLNYDSGFRALLDDKQDLVL